jgi:hypothetical protein
MKRKKLTLDKLVIGSLSDAEQANIFGGDDDGSASRVVDRLTHCIGGGTPGSGGSTDVTHTCPVTMPPTPASGMTCPVSTTKKP